MTASRVRPGPWALTAGGAALFVLLAIANSAGYRYGASDQAFYVPAAARAADPTLFPRDASLLDAQARLTAADELLAEAGRALRLAQSAVSQPKAVGAAVPLDLSVVLFVGYIAGLLLLCVAACGVGTAMNGSVWTATALAAALTLRHGISRAGVNTLEGYFHPRLVVFAAGIVAVACFLRGRTWRALLIILVAAMLHPTTGLWFLIWISVAAIAADRKARRPIAGLAALAAMAAIWAVAAGPLAGRFVRMDSTWLAALDGKDYLFPDRWPAYAWMANLAYPVVIGALTYARRRGTQQTPNERGLVAGALVLFVIFLASVPFNRLRLALVVQLQIPRIFWMLDFLATALLIAWLTERARSRAALVAGTLVVVAAARGMYIINVEFPERPLVQVRLPPDDWRDAMTWAAATPPGTHWLAHPGHAHLYGSSVRVAAARDVLHEAVKDSALAMYARPIAERVIERSRALADFDTLDGTKARALASRYELDYLITETRGLALPVAYSNPRFVIYRLR